MHLVKPRWQAKSRATLRLQAHSRVMRRALLQANSPVKTAPLEANSRVMRRALLQANSRVKTAPLEANSRAIRRALLQANSPVKTADPPSPGLRRASWRPPLLEPQDWLLLQASEIPRARVRVRRCLRGPVPSAFFPEIPADRKCNRAARCGYCPISAQYRRRCSRRGLVGYGNRRSRLLRKRARPG